LTNWSVCFMRNFLLTQRRWWWLAAAVLLVVLAACVAQIPAAPATPATVATDSAAEATAEPTEATAVEATTVATATEETAPSESVTETATVMPSEEVTGTDEVTGSEEVTATEATTATEGSATGEPVASDSDGEASVVVEDEGATGEVSATSAVELMGGNPLPSEENYKGLPVGFTEEGLPYRGDPNAPIVMVEYSDFQCPFCNRHFVQTEPALDESYVRTGQVRVVFFDFPLVSLHPNAPAAHEASLCVAGQGSAASYWNYNAQLFRTVDEWNTLSDPLPVFERLAEQTGIDIAVYTACMTSHEKQALVQERVDAAFARGFSATPSFQVVRAEDDAVFQVIGAQPYEQFAGIVDSALAGEMPVAEAPQPEQQEGIPFWATADGWKPDPNRPGFNMAGDEYRGDVNAPLTVIEFSDFQCPYCLRHNTETQPALDEKYVDSGKVLWVYKNFPLNIHPQAPAAAIASECAAEQGKFWEMHEVLFNSVDSWAIADPTPVFAGLATDLGMDSDAFTACLSNPDIKARVDSDLAEGAQFVQGTPTFIIVNGSQGSIIPGALPEATFSKVLDDELAKTGTAQ
jgi:protein-disulfide isomerase